MPPEVNLTFKVSRTDGEIDLAVSFPPSAADLADVILSILSLQQTSVDILDGETVEVPSELLAIHNKRKDHGCDDVCIPTLILTDGRLSPEGRLTYGVIAELNNGDKGLTVQDAKTHEIRKETGESAVDELVETGLVELVPDGSEMRVSLVNLAAVYASIQTPKIKETP
jgi:hypothetical protein